MIGIPPRWKAESNALSSSALNESSHGDASSNASPIPPVRRLAKSFSVAPSSTHIHKGILAFKLFIVVSVVLQLYALVALVDVWL